MKIAFQIQLIVSAVFFFGLGCTSDDPKPASKDKITGTWIEKNPGYHPIFCVNVKLQDLSFILESCFQK